jgi:type II secretion system protein H
MMARPRLPPPPGPSPTRGEGWERGERQAAASTAHVWIAWSGRVSSEMRIGGFTLIELLVVMAMLAIAAAVAVPALRPPAERSVGAASDSLLHVLARARADAAARGVPVRVEVRAGDGAFAVMAETDGGMDTLRAGSLPLPADGRVVGGREGIARIAFDASGRARADRVAVTGDGGRIDVAVDPWSGIARAAR